MNPKKQPSDLRMYDVKEAAALLHLSPDRVRVLVKQKRIKGFLHFGSLNLPKIFILEKDLKRFIEDDFLCEYVAGRRKPRRKPRNVWK
jgi:hypothetical protein